MRTIPELRAEIGRLVGIGLPGPFRFTAVHDSKHAGRWIADLSPGGLGLLDRDYYFRADSVRDRYVAYIAALFVLSGHDSSEAARVMRLETAAHGSPAGHGADLGVDQSPCVGAVAGRRASAESSRIRRCVWMHSRRSNGAA